LFKGDLFQPPPPRRCTILQGNLLDGPRCASCGQGPWYVSLFTTVILIEQKVTQRQRADPLFTALLSRLQMGFMTANVQFLNTYVGATPVAATTHGTGVDAIQPAVPQTPTAPALKPLPPMGMAALCFDNSTRSARNDIASREAEADGRTVYKIVAATLPSGRTRGDMAPAYRERLLQLPDKNADLLPHRARLVRGSAHGLHHQHLPAPRG